MKIPTTDINFPDVFCISRSGYGLQALPTFETATMTSGRPESYRLFSFVPSEVNIRLVLNDGDALAFEMWFRDVIDDGVKWFNVNIRTPRARNDNVVAKFKGMYSGSQLLDNGDFWVYTFTLYVFERPLWGNGFGKFPDFVANASRFDALMNWVWPIYEDDDPVILLDENGAPIFTENGDVGESKPVKISQLPETFILTGDEYVPVVQSGVTKKVKSRTVSTSDDTEYLDTYENSKDEL